MFGLFRKTKPEVNATGYVWKPDAHLLRLSTHSVLTREAATQNILVTGGTGMGKTSASGRSLALALLDKRGMAAGMLVCCAKADEVDLWKEYAAETGRTADLRVIEPGGNRFNPVSHELSRQGAVASAENVVGLLEAIMECAEGSGAGSGQDREPYWARAAKQLVRNFVELQILATGTVTIESTYRAVIEAPQSADEVRSTGWRESSYCFKLLREADARPKTPSQARDFALVTAYILTDFANLASRTRSTVVSHLTSQLDPMQRGVLRDLFGADSTVTPEDCSDGAIIVCGLPTQTFREVGLLANTCLKYCWQRSMEGRRLARASRPCVLWCDEFQTVVTPRDAQFLAACRSSRVGCVLLTQGVPGVHAALGGGDKGRSEADAIFGNCTTKVFHANSDPVTNEWAAGIIGKSRQLLANGNSSYSSDDQWSASLGLDWLGGERNVTSGFAESVDYEIQPREFSLLRPGGVAHGRLVDAIVFQNGRVFPETGRTWLPVTFRQKG